MRYVHVTLHKALKQAVLDGLLPRNVTVAVKPPQINREDMNPLTPDQAKTLSETAHTVSDRLEELYVLWPSPPGYDKENCSGSSGTTLTLGPGCCK